MISTLTTQTAADTQISQTVNSLTGFHPALDRVVNALQDLADADLTADETQSVVGAIGAIDTGNVNALVGLIVRHLADPDRNPALADLPTERAQTLRRLGAEYAAGASTDRQQDTAAEISAAIEGV